MEFMYVAIGGLVLVAFYVVSVYNGLQSLLTEIEAAIQEIGNQLKRQASLIPNLEQSVKAFLKQEKDIFGMLTEARKSVVKASESGSAKDIQQAEAQIQAVLPKLQIAIEDNPELKSNETVEQFMSELRDTADKLMYSRRAVIDLTQQFNQRIVTFPNNLVAGMFGFKKQVGMQMAADKSFQTVSAEEMRDPKVNL